MTLSSMVCEFDQEDEDKGRARYTADGKCCPNNRVLVTCQLGIPMCRHGIRIYSARFVAIALLMAISLVAAPVDRWHERGPLPEAPHLREIVYGNGLFVAVGSVTTNSVFATSRDGRSWDVQWTTNINLASIAFGNGRFVAFGDGSRNPYRGLVSRDGLNWTEIILPGTGSGVFNVSDVTSAPHGFSAVATYILPGPFPGSFVGYSYYAFSADVYTWYASFPGGPPYLRGITSGRGALVAFETYQGSRILVSTNGPWNTTVTNPPAPFVSVSFEGNKFLAGAANDQSSTNRVCLVYISTNAINWTSHSISNCLRDVSFGDGTYAAVDDATISVSPDGIVWTGKYQHPSARFTSIAYGVGTFVAVGERGTIVQSDPFAPILALRAAGTNLQLEVFAEPGNYELHSSPNFQTWHNADPFTNNGTSVLDLQPTGGQRFYRARRLP